MVDSDFAVRGQLSQGVYDFSEGGALFEAKRPAARHELVDPGGTSVWNRQLQLPCLQTWRGGDPAERGRLNKIRNMDTWVIDHNI